MYHAVQDGRRHTRKGGGHHHHQGRKPVGTLIKNAQA